MIFEEGKENDLEAGVKSSNIYSTSWPKDSKVVREEVAIRLEALGEAVSSGKARFWSQQGGEENVREEEKRDFSND